MTIFKFASIVIAATIFVAPAKAIVLSGSFGDPNNTALVGSDLSSPTFTDAYAIANNVAIYSFSVPVTEVVVIRSLGYASGAGADPYFTLFQGADQSATFLTSNYDQAFSTGGDFVISTSLTAGEYQIALGVFANMSFAENLGSGTLADGFIFLGDPNSLNNGAYSIEITEGNISAVPELSTWAMMMLGFVGIGTMTYRRRKSSMLAA